MIEKIIKALAGLAPFLAPYPLWVKLLFSVWVIITAVLFSISSFHTKSTFANTRIARWNATFQRRLVHHKRRRKLYIRGRRDESQSHGHRDGVDYVYPSLTDAEWMEVSPDMSSQRFRLPPASRGYDVKFKMAGWYAGKEFSMISQWVEHVDNLPFSGRYDLHVLHPESRTRSGEISATVMYEIKESPD